MKSNAFSLSHNYVQRTTRSLLLSCFSTALVILTLIVLASTAQAQNPRPGYYEYGNYAELVLPQPTALKLAQYLSTPTTDDIALNREAGNVVDELIRELGSSSPQGASVAIFLKVLKMAANYFYWVPSHHMLSDSKDPSVEVVKFRLWYGIPYWSDAYYFPDGKLLREKSDATVYVMIGGAKFGIPGSEFGPMGYSGSNIVVVENGRLRNISYIPRTYTLIRERSDGTVYLIDLRQRWALTYQAFIRMGFAWHDVKVIPNGTAAQIPFGGIIYN